MEITEHTVDAFLHYLPRILLALCAVGFVIAILGIALGWK